MRGLACAGVLLVVAACADGETSSGGNGGTPTTTTGGAGGEAGSTNVTGGAGGVGQGGSGGTPDTYAVSGTITGLKGTLVLLNNDGDDLTLTAADTSFTFATEVADGSAYDVTILTEPGTQRCAVSTGSGTIAGAAISDVSVSCEDQLFFFAYTTAGTSRLHKTDGTMSGTIQVSFIGPSGDLRQAPYEGIHLDNGYSVFVADDGTRGTELWRSDGGNDTGIVLEIDGGGSSNPGQFTLLDGGHALFTATDPTNGRELWITDGTDVGTMLVKDIRPGSSGSRITMSGPAELGGFVYFTADDGTNGTELWRSNGTEAGTTLVHDVTGDGNDGAQGAAWVGGGAVYFTGIDSVTGTEPWVSDGTTTTLLLDITAGGDSSPRGFVESGGAVYFVATVSGDRELWSTDGTMGGTARVKNINTGGSDQVGNIVAFNGGVVFSADDGSSGIEPWISDGTDGGTMLLTQVEAGSGASARSFAAHGGFVTFAGDTNLQGEEMWVTGGTTATTLELVDAFPGNTDGFVEEVPGGNNGRIRIYWAEGVGSGIEPWVTDGTAGGTMLLSDICPATCDSWVTE